MAEVDRFFKIDSESNIDSFFKANKDVVDKQGGNGFETRIELYTDAQQEAVRAESLKRDLQSLRRSIPSTYQMGLFYDPDAKQTVVVVYDESYGTPHHYKDGKLYDAHGKEIKPEDRKHAPVVYKHSNTSRNGLVSGKSGTTGFVVLEEEREKPRTFTRSSAEFAMIRRHLKRAGGSKGITLETIGSAFKEAGDLPRTILTEKKEAQKELDKEARREAAALSERDQAVRRAIKSGSTSVGVFINDLMGTALRQIGATSVTGVVGAIYEALSDATSPEKVRVLLEKNLSGRGVSKKDIDEAVRRVQAAKPQLKGLVLPTQSDTAASTGDIGVSKALAEAVIGTFGPARNQGTPRMVRMPGTSEAAKAAVKKYVIPSVFRATKQQKAVGVGTRRAEKGVLSDQDMIVGLATFGDSIVNAKGQVVEVFDDAVRTQQDAMILMDTARKTELKIQGSLKEVEEAAYKLYKAKSKNPVSLEEFVAKENGQHGDAYKKYTKQYLTKAFGSLPEVRGRKMQQALGGVSLDTVEFGNGAISYIATEAMPTGSRAKIISLIDPSIKGTVQETGYEISVGGVHPTKSNGAFAVKIPSLDDPRKGIWTFASLFRSSMFESLLDESRGKTKKERIDSLRKEIEGDSSIPKEIKDLLLGDEKRQGLINEESEYQLADFINGIRGLRDTHGWSDKKTGEMILQAGLLFDRLISHSYYRDAYGSQRIFEQNGKKWKVNKNAVWRIFSDVGQANEYPAYNGARMERPIGELLNVFSFLGQKPSAEAQQTILDASRKLGPSQDDLDQLQIEQNAVMLAKAANLDAAKGIHTSAKRVVVGKDDQGNILINGKKIGTAERPEYNDFGKLTNYDKTVQGIIYNELLKKYNGDQSALEEAIAKGEIFVEYDPLGASRRKNGEKLVVGEGKSQIAVPTLFLAANMFAERNMQTTAAQAFSHQFHPGVGISSETLTELLTTAENEVNHEDGVIYQRAHGNPTPGSVEKKLLGMSADWYKKWYGKTDGLSAEQIMLGYSSVHGAIGGEDYFMKNLGAASDDSIREAYKRLTGEELILKKRSKKYAETRRDAIKRIAKFFTIGAKENNDLIAALKAEAKTEGKDFYSLLREKFGTISTLLGARAPYSHVDNNNFQTLFIAGKNASEDRLKAIAEDNILISLATQFAAGADFDGDVAYFLGVGSDKDRERAFGLTSDATYRLRERRAAYKAKMSEAKKGDGTIDTESLGRIVDEDLITDAQVLQRTQKSLTGSLANFRGTMMHYITGLVKEGQEVDPSLLITHAFLEGIAQDAISSKKVINQLIKSAGGEEWDGTSQMTDAQLESYEKGLNDLTTALDNMFGSNGSGNFWEFIDALKKIGLVSVDENGNAYFESAKKEITADTVFLLEEKHGEELKSKYGLTTDIDDEKFGKFSVINSIIPALKKSMELMGVQGNNPMSLFKYLFQHRPDAKTKARGYNLFSQKDVESVHEMMDSISSTDESIKKLGTAAEETSKKLGKIIELLTKGGGLIGQMGGTSDDRQKALEKYGWSAHGGWSAHDVADLISPIAYRGDAGGYNSIELMKKLFSAGKIDYDTFSSLVSGRPVEGEQKDRATLRKAINSLMTSQLNDNPFGEDVSLDDRANALTVLRGTYVGKLDALSKKKREKLQGIYDKMQENIKSGRSAMAGIKVDDETLQFLAVREQYIQALKSSGIEDVDSYLKTAERMADQQRGLRLPDDGWRDLTAEAPLVNGRNPDGRRMPRTHGFADFLISDKDGRVFVYESKTGTTAKINENEMVQAQVYAAIANNLMTQMGGFYSETMPGSFYDRGELGSEARESFIKAFAKKIREDKKYAKYITSDEDAMKMAEILFNHSGGAITSILGKVGADGARERKTFKDLDPYEMMMLLENPEYFNQYPELKKHLFAGELERWKSPAEIAQEEEEKRRREAEELKKQQDELLKRVLEGLKVYKKDVEILGGIDKLGLSDLKNPTDEQKRAQERVEKLAKFGIVSFDSETGKSTISFDKEKILDRLSQDGIDELYRYIDSETISGLLSDQAKAEKAAREAQIAAEKEAREEKARKAAAYADVLKRLHTHLEAKRQLERADNGDITLKEDDRQAVLDRMRSLPLLENGKVNWEALWSSIPEQLDEAQKQDIVDRYNSKNVDEEILKLEREAKDREQKEKEAKKLIDSYYQLQKDIRGLEYAGQDISVQKLGLKGIVEKLDELGVASGYTIFDEATQTLPFASLTSEEINKYIQELEAKDQATKKVEEQDHLEEQINEKIKQRYKLLLEIEELQRKINRAVAAGVSEDDPALKGATESLNALEKLALGEEEYGKLEEARKVLQDENTNKDGRKVAQETVDRIMKNLFQSGISYDPKSKGFVGLGLLDKDGKPIDGSALEEARRKNSIALLEEQQKLYNKKRLEWQMEDRRSAQSGEGATPWQRGINWLRKDMSGGAKTILQSFVRGGVTAKILSTLIGSLKKTIQLTQQLDASMTNLRVITGKSSEDAQRLMYDYNKLADGLGTTTQAIAQAGAEWLRQGYNVSATQKLIESSTKLARLGFMDQGTAVKSLTAAMKGFNLTANDSALIVDKLTTLDAKYATTAGDIATALTRVASIANNAGMNLDETAAAITAIIDTTQQDAGTVGNALKTMLSRYGNVKAGAFASMFGDEEDAENINDVERVLNSLGIQLRTSKMELRDFADVLDDIAERWVSLTTVEQNAIVTALAGTRQRNTATALLNSYSTYKSALRDQENAQGKADRKYQAYEDSIEFQKQRLANAWEYISSKMKQSAMIKAFYKATTGIVKNLDKILPAIIGTLMTIWKAININNKTLTAEVRKIGAKLGVAQSGNTWGSLVTSPFGVKKDQYVGPKSVNGKLGGVMLGGAGYGLNAMLSGGGMFGNLMDEGRLFYKNDISNYEDTADMLITGGVTTAASAIGLAFLGPVGGMLGAVLGEAVGSLIKQLRHRDEAKRAEEIEEKEEILEAIQSATSAVGSLHTSVLQSQTSWSSSDRKQAEDDLDLIKEAYKNSEDMRSALSNINDLRKELYGGSEFNPTELKVANITSQQSAALYAAQKIAEAQAQYNLTRLTEDSDLEKELLEATGNFNSAATETEKQKYKRQINSILYDMEAPNRDLDNAYLEAALYSSGAEAMSTTELNRATLDRIILQIAESWGQNNPSIFVDGKLTSDARNKIIDAIQKDDRLKNTTAKSTHTLYEMLTAQSMFKPNKGDTAEGLKGLSYSSLKKKGYSDTEIDLLYLADSDALNRLASGLGMTAEEANKLKDSLWWVSDATIANGIDGLVSSFEGLSSILSEIAHSSTISDKTMKNILENYDFLLTDSETGEISSGNIMKNITKILTDGGYVVSGQLMTQRAVTDETLWKKFLQQYIAKNPENTDMYSELSGYTSFSQAMNTMYNPENANALALFGELAGELVGDMQITQAVRQILIEAENKTLENEISNLQSVKDSLEDVNKQRQKELDLIKAKIALENAQKEKKRVYREGVGFVYTSDQTAIKEAADNLEKLEREKDQNSLQYQIDMLNQQKDILSNIENNEQLSGIYDLLNSYMGQNGRLGSMINFIDSIKPEEINKLIAGYVAKEITSGEVYEDKITEANEAKRKLENSVTAFNDFMEKTDDNGVKISDIIGYNSDSVNYLHPKYDEYYAKAEDLRQGVVNAKNNLAQYSNLGKDYEVSSDVSDIANQLFLSSEQGRTINLNKTDFGSKGGKYKKNLRYNIASEGHYNGTKESVPEQISQGKWSDLNYNVLGDNGSLSTTWYNGANSDSVMGQESGDDKWKNWPKNAIYLNGDGYNAGYYLDRQENWHKLVVADPDVARKSGYEWHIGAYASGTTSYPGGASLINERGLEGIITPEGTLTSLPAKSGILPADLTKNLWSLGEVAPNLITELSGKSFSRVNEGKIEDNSMTVGTLNATFNTDSGFDAKTFWNDVKSQIALTKNNH